MASKLPSFQDAINGIKNAGGSVLQSVGNFLNRGVQNVQQSVQQNPNQYNIFANMNQIAPQPQFGSLGYQAMQPFEAAQNWIESPNRSDLLPMINAQTPILGRAGSFGRGLLNIPAALGNTVIGHGVIDPSLDLGRNIFKAGTGQALTGYEQNKSPITRFGYQVGNLLNPQAGQELGVNNNAQNWIGNAAGIANPILTAYSLSHSGATFDKSAPLLQRMIAGAKSGSRTGALFGGMQGLEDNRTTQSLDEQFAKAGGQAVTGGIMGGIFGGAMPAVQAGGGYLFDKAKSALQDQSGFMSLGGTPGSELNDMLNRLPDSGDMPTSGSMEGKYMGKDVNEVIYKMQQGAKPMDLMHEGYDSGALQEASQRLRGYGLLADLDEAIKANNPGDVKRIAQQISQDPKYTDYIPQLKNYLSQFVDQFGTPNPATPGVGDVLNNEQGFLKVPGTGESIFRNGEQNFTDNADLTYQQRFNMPVLKRLNAGSDRVVYDLGDNVIKVAKNARGLVQNSNELDWYAQDQGLIPKIIEQGKDYVVMQKVDPPDAATKDFVKQLSQFSAEDWRNHTGPLQDLLEKYGMTDLMNYDPLVGDLGRIRNWGTLDGKPILVDGGALSDKFVKDFAPNGSTQANGVAQWLQDTKDEFNGYNKINKGIIKDPTLANIVKDQQGFLNPNAQVLPGEDNIINGGANALSPDQQFENLKKAGLEPQQPGSNAIGGEQPDLNSNPNPQIPNGKTVQDALYARFSARQMLEQHADVLTKAIDNAVQPEETDLFRNAIEHPENLDKNAAQAANPEAFKAATQDFQNFTDYVYKQLKDNNSKVGYLDDYYSHILDLSNPDDAARYQDFINAKATNYKGWFNKERVFDNIDQLKAAGFKLKNDSVGADIADYVKAAQKELGGRVLVDQLKQVSPGSVYTTDSGEAPPANFIQSRIPGMKGTYLSPDMHEQVKQLEPGDMPQVIRTADKINQIDKQMKLAGGGFHAINEFLDYAGNELTHLRIPRIGEMTKIFFSPDEWQNYQQDALDAGTVQRASDMGVTLGHMDDISGNQDSIASQLKAVNPVAKLNQAIFGRLIPFFKLETVKNLDTEGLSDEEARALGSQVNNIFGGLNRDVGQGVLQSKNSQMLARFAFLAPDYQEGRFTRTINAANVTKWDASSILARTSLLGRVMVTGLIAELGKRVVQGSFDTNLKDAIDRALLNPRIPLPFTDQSGRPQSGALPASNLSDIPKLLQDPSHFLISHLGALPSNAFQFLSNQNYYGKPLSPTNNSLEKAGALIPNNLPIPIYQAMQVAQGKENIPSAITNTVGLRVKADDQTESQFFNQYAQLKQYNDQYNALKYKDQMQAQQYYAQNKDKIDQFNSMKGLNNAYWQLRDAGDVQGAIKLLKGQTGETPGGVSTQSGNTQQYPDLSNTTQQNTSNNPEDVFAQEENMRNAMQLFYQSQYVNPKSSLSKDQLNKIYQSQGIDPQDVYWRYVGGLRSESRAKFLDGYFNQATSQQDANQRLTDMIDKGVLTNGVVDDMTGQNLISIDQANYLKTAIKGRANIKKGLPAGGKPKKGRAAPKFKVPTTVYKSKKITLGSTKFKLKDIAPKSIRAKHLA